MKYAILIFLVLLALPAFGALNIREINRTSDQESGAVVDDIEWWQGESIVYNIELRREKDRISIPTNAYPVWRVWQSDALTNLYVSSTGTVTSATNGQLQVTLTPSEANLPTGNYVSVISVYEGTTQMGVGAKSELDVHYNAVSDDVTYVGTSPLFDQTATAVTSTGTYANVQAWLNALAELAFVDWPASDGNEYVVKNGAWFEHTDSGTPYSAGYGLDLDGTNIRIHVTNSWQSGYVLKTETAGTNWYWTEDNFEANTDNQTALEVSTIGFYENVQLWIDALNELAFQDWPANDGNEYVAKNRAWFEHTDSDTTYSAGYGLDLDGTNIRIHVTNSWQSGYVLKTETAGTNWYWAPDVSGGSSPQRSATLWDGTDLLPLVQDDAGWVVGQLDDGTHMMTGVGYQAATNSAVSDTFMYRWQIPAAWTSWSTNRIHYFADETNLQFVVTMYGEQYNAANEQTNTVQVYCSTNYPSTNDVPTSFAVGASDLDSTNYPGFVFVWEGYSLNTNVIYLDKGTIEQ